MSQDTTVGMADDAGEARDLLPRVAGLAAPGASGPVAAEVFRLLVTEAGRPSAPADSCPEPSWLPARWAVGFVALVLVIVGVLIGIGRPFGAVLEGLGGGGWLAIELLRILKRGL